MSILRERFPFWGLEYHKVEGERLAYCSWLWAIGTAVIGVLLYNPAVAMRASAGVYLLLGVLVLAHLQARSATERILPNPSWAEDLRTGNLEQFRLLPWTAHELLLHRSVPALFYRWVSQVIWLPLYVLWSVVAGLGLWDGLALWLLFSFAVYPVLAIASFYLLMPIGWTDWGWIFGVALLGYAFSGEGRRVVLSGISGWLMGLLVALPLFLRVLLPPAWTLTLPEIVPFVVLWLIVEAVRWERWARWLNPPTGWGPLYRWVAGGALLGFVAWHIAQVLPWLSVGGSVHAEVVSVALFAFTNYLSFLWLVLERGRERVLQGWRVHLTEVALLHLGSLMVLGISTVWLDLSWSAPRYWALFASFTLVDIVGGALFRYGFQRVWARTSRLAWWILGVGLLPAITAPITLNVGGLEPLALLSPTVALLSQTPPARVKAPALWLIWLLSTVRYVLVLGWLWWASRERITQRWRHGLGRLLRLVGWLFWYGLLDVLARNLSTNPISQLLREERRLDLALPLALGTAGLGLIWEPSSAVGAAILGMIPLGAWLWYWGYSSAHRTVRKLMDAGELSQWFLTKLEPPAIFWGIVYAFWFFQVRLLLAYWGGLMVAVLWRSVIEGSWFAVPVMVGFTPFWATLVLVWSCIWLIAAPNGVRDALVADPHRGGAPPVQVALKAMLMSGLGCFAFILAPLALIGLPLYCNQSILVLRRLHRYPESS